MKEIFPDSGALLNQTEFSKFALSIGTQLLLFWKTSTLVMYTQAPWCTSTLSQDATLHVTTNLVFYLQIPPALPVSNTGVCPGRPRLLLSTWKAANIVEGQDVSTWLICATWEEDQEGEIRGRWSHDGHTQYSSCGQKNIRLPHNWRWCLQASSMGLLLINLQCTLRYCLHSSTDRTPAVLEYTASPLQTAVMLLPVVVNRNS